MLSMGIDIGTTTISIVMTDEETGRQLGSRTMQSDAFLPSEHDYQKIQDPEKIFQTAWRGMKELIDACGEPARIGMTGQMHGMLYIDAEGKHVSPLYTWQDESGGVKVREGSSAAHILRHHGLAGAAGYGLSTYYYHQMTEQVPEQAAAMVTISDYVAMRLCGSKDPMIGTDMAASWGCFDLKKGCFEKDSMLRLGMDISLLPAVHKEHDIVGYLDKRIPVMLSLGDNQASFLGAVQEPGNTVLLNIGTGAQVSFVSDQFHKIQGSIELRPFVHDRYLMVGASLCGGRAYAMLEKFYREIAMMGLEEKGLETGQERELQEHTAQSLPDAKIYTLMEQQARAFRESRGLENAWKVTPTFAGTRSNPVEKGSISEISVDNFCPGALTLGMMEGMIRELHEMYLEMCMLTGRKASKLVGSGNALRQNALLREIAEEIFGMEMTVPDSEEEAAYGAACGAGGMTV